METKRIKVLVTGGHEFEEAIKEGLPNWFTWDTTRKFYIGNTIRKHINMLKYRLVPYSIYHKTIEVS